MSIDIWNILSLVGTVAFASSGAIVAIEEEFDILGLFILGFVTAFGGGAIRNVLIGLPIETLWSQGIAFYAAAAAILFIMIFPNLLSGKGRDAEVVSDAIGLAAFSVQGALYATQSHQPLSAVIVAAVLTGAGGGIVRDVLAGRKPGVLRSEIYAGWSILVGIILYFKIAKTTTDYYLLVLVVTSLRIWSSSKWDKEKNKDYLNKY
ncbi:TPA: trimeric intracellular cation channel family protein [Streptococcus agalactiae]|nr:trimeric intracellular cation channel family protein [Streptococcus agalactiae]HEO0472382.1 trimeric intracellular cation channel family protein [Streptococcus agalactiae]